MSTSTDNPWPLTGLVRIVMCIIWVLVFLFLMFAYYGGGFKEVMDYARRGAIGIMFEKAQDGSTALSAVVNGGPANQAGLKTGDKLIQVDGHIVKPETEYPEISSWFRGDIGTKVSVRVHGSDNQERNITVVRGKLLSDLVYAWSDFAQTLIIFISGLLIFWRRPGSGYMFFVSLGLVLLGLGNSWFATDASFLPQFMTALGMILALFIVLTYPNGSFFPGWSILIGFWGVILYGLLLFPAPLNPYGWPYGVFNLAQRILFGAGLACQVYRYRQMANPTEKRQLHWALWGAAIMFIVFVLNGVISRIPDVGTWIYINSPAQIFHDLIMVLGFLAAPVTLVVSLYQREHG